MKHRKLKPIFMLTALLALSSCKNPGDFTFTNEPAFELDVIKIVSYEVETVTTRITEEGNTSEISQIRAMPVIDRVALKYGIDKYGATETFIDVLKPKQQLPPDDIPSNTFTEAKYIHIVNGLGSFYDAKRNLLYTQPMDGANIAQIDEFTAKKGDIEAMLNVAKNNGAIINDLGNGFISIRMGSEQFATTGVNQSNSEATIMDDTYTVTIFNNLTNSLVGSAIYDNSDNMLFRMYAQSELNASGDLVLTATQQEVFDVNPISNLTTVIKTNSVYSNLEIEEMQ